LISVQLKDVLGEWIAFFFFQYQPYLFFNGAQRFS
jgi:hypothetical protein